MAYLSEDEIYTAYKEACTEADQWRIDYPQYERLANNGLLDDLDENLPEVNDGSLAASLFKLAKRVIKKKLSGRAVALDSSTSDAAMTELANLWWEKKILPSAKAKASPRRKWKDAVRKAAIYGGQPIITLPIEHGGTVGADFIVPYAQDVKLEAGKDSDEDSDIIFWDVYYSKLQARNMLEQAQQEIKDGVSKALPAQAAEDSGSATAYSQANTNKPSKKVATDAESAAEDAAEPGEEPYNYWNIEALQAIVDGEAPEEKRPGNETPKQEQDNSVKKGGLHFCVAFQRGVGAPFVMYYPDGKKTIRQWTNPDPTGDIPVHYLYCYQDFINPYGIGIVKLAGGTQNVLDYMRQADVLATQLGLRPPKQIRGDEDQVDEDSLVYAQDANWYVGTATVERMEMANGVYQELPGRISMYQTSLQKMIPIGDTTISGSDSGDPNVSKTPAGVKLQAQNLSIDDEDFAENVDECYAAVAKSMINVEFAIKQGKDLLKLNDEERQILQKTGIEFPTDATGQPTNQLEIEWDQLRGTFDFEIDPDADKTMDDAQALEGKLKAYELLQADPTIDQYLQQDGKRLNRGELLAEIFNQLTDNDKIVVDISPEDQQQLAATGALQPGQQDQGTQTDRPKLPSESITFKDVVAAGATDAAAAMLEQAGLPSDNMRSQTPAPGQVIGGKPQQPAMQPGAASAPSSPAEGAEATPDAEGGQDQLDDQTIQQQLQMTMETFNVDEPTAAAMLEAERQGYQPQEILDALRRSQGVSNAAA